MGKLGQSVRTGRKYEIPEDRIWENIKEDSSTGCWEWQLGKTEKGYGATGTNKGGRARAHRLAYEAFVGKIPKGMLVCHSCDNPGCCNPMHLFIGTAADNTSDMVSKNRHRASLSKEEVTEARQSLRSGAETPAEVARRLGVTPQVVYLFEYGKTYRDAGGPIKTKKKEGSNA